MELDTELSTRIGISQDNLVALLKATDITVLDFSNPQYPSSLPPGSIMGDYIYVLMPVSCFSYEGIPALKNGRYYYRKTLPEDFVEVPGEFAGNAQQISFTYVLDQYNSSKSSDSSLLINGKRYIPTKRYDYNNSSWAKVPDIHRIKKYNPKEYTQWVISNAEKARQDEVTKLIEQRSNLAEANKDSSIRLEPIGIPRSHLSELSEYVYFVASSTNLQELLCLDGVDHWRSYCNNMHTMAQLVGIEASRTYIYNSLIGVITGTGLYVHEAHTEFISNFHTVREVTYGVTFTGISRQPSGHLALATVEKARGLYAECHPWQSRGHSKRLSRHCIGRAHHSGYWLL